MASVVFGMRWDGGSNKRGNENKSSVTTCTTLKNAFHECFNRWYSEKFVKGQWEQEDCMAEWEAYRACTAKRYEDRNLSHLMNQEPHHSSKDNDQ